MKKRSKSRQGLSSNERAWLDGDAKTSGFQQFKPDDELSALFESYGDKSKMWWRPDMPVPITLEELSASEASWCEDGGSAYVVYRYFSDDEKAALFKERGDKKRFRWDSPLRRPEAI